MNVHGCAEVLSPEERQRVHAAVVRILGEMGARVDHERMRRRLADAGARLGSDGVVTLSEQRIDELVAASQVADRPERLRFNAGGYPQRYLDPDTGRAVPHTMRTCRDYIRLADQLDQIDSMNCVGYPTDVAPGAMRLYEKFLSFLAHKPYHSDEVTCAEEVGPYEDLCAAREQMTGIPTPVRGKIYLNYPLHVGREHAELFFAFYDRGHRASLPCIPTAGGTSPITIPGALAHTIAASMFHGFLMGALYGTPSFGLGSFGGFLDLRTAVVVKGRPECALMIMAMHDMARHYGVYCVLGGQFQPQAKTIDSVQSGVERMMEALPALLAGGTSFGSLGGISQPEHITSPIQLVIDDEVAAMLRRFAAGPEVNDETLAVDALVELGHDALFMAHPHTAERCREAFMMPLLFTGGIGYDQWLDTGGETAVRRAEKRYREIMAQPYEPAIDPEQQEGLLTIVRKAARFL